MVVSLIVCLLSFGKCVLTFHLVWCLVQSVVHGPPCPAICTGSNRSTFLLGTTLRSWLADLFTQKALAATGLVNGIYVSWNKISGKLNLIG